MIRNFSIRTQVLRLCVVMMCISSLHAPGLFAQESLTPQERRDINISRSLIDGKRNKMLAFNMTFTEKEKHAFWPLYREYRAEMGKLGDRQLSIIIDYADHMNNMSDEKARVLLDASMKIEKDELKLREKYVQKFRRILPDIKVVRLMQLEHRMNAMVDLKIAEGVPLME